MLWLFLFGYGCCFICVLIYLVECSIVCVFCLILTGIVMIGGCCWCLGDCWVRLFSVYFDLVVLLLVIFVVFSCNNSWILVGVFCLVFGANWLVILVYCASCFLFACDLYLLLIYAWVIAFGCLFCWFKFGFCIVLICRLMLYCLCCLLLEWYAVLVICVCVWLLLVFVVCSLVGLVCLL